MSRDNNRRSNGHRSSTLATDSTVSGGYDAEFDPPLDTKYVCPVCLAVLRAPLQTKCGHRFCGLCMRRIISNRPHTKCPVDKTWLDVKADMFEDVAFEREILSMTVKCSNAISGCAWTGDLRHLQSHCDNCPCTKLVCPNGCEEQYLRGNSEEHLRDCPEQALDCAYCSETILRKDEPRHQMLCLRYPIQCPECGNAGIIREEMSKHTDTRQGSCPSTIIPCAFQEIGCKGKVKRSELAAHCQDAAAEHLQLLLAQVTSQNDLLQTQTALLEEKSKTCSQLVSQMQAIKCILEEKDQLLNQQMERISHLENTNYSGRLHWRVDLGSRPLSGPAGAASARILSPAFYTGRPGYKLRACLEFNGHATRSATYTSLFVVLQPGEFDAGLRFPFAARCRVALFDQASVAGPGGRTEREDFVTAIACSNLARAGAGCGSDQLRGRLRFMQTDALLGGRFCRDDCLFLQIDVDLSPAAQCQTIL